MALHEVIGHSVTVQARGFDHNGDAAEGRHWLKGAIIDIDGADARSLVAAKAVAPGASKPASAEPAAEPAKEPAKKDGK